MSELPIASHTRARSLAFTYEKSERQRFLVCVCVCAGLDANGVHNRKSNERKKLRALICDGRLPEKNDY